MAAEDRSVLVLGAGSIGLYLAGLLLSQKFQVRLLGRAGGFTEIQKNGGLLLTDLFGARKQVNVDELSSPCIAVSRDSPPIYSVFPLVSSTLWTSGEEQALRLAGQHRIFLVCGKSGATAEMADFLVRVAPYIEHRPALVFSCQNGTDNAKRLRDKLPSEVYTVLSCVVGFNVTWEAGGHHVHRATSNPLIIEWNPALWHDDPSCSALVRTMAESLTRSGCKTLLEHDDIEKVKWAKLVINLGNAINALSGIPLYDQLNTPGYRLIGELAIDEALQVLRRAQIPVGRVGILSPWLLKEFLATPQFLFAQLATIIVKIDRAANSSMQQDLVAGRETEIDELQGKIVELAKQQNISAPINQTIMELVRAATIEAKGPPRLSAEAILRRIEQDAGRGYVQKIRRRNSFLRQSMMFVVGVVLFILILIIF